jgi:16S rRNA (cytosine1402-N4)-methyltransferase
MMSDYHIPVMAPESVEGLNIHPDGVYVDATFGGGGHSRLILNKLGSKGRLIAFDRDPDAMRNLPDDNRLFFVNHNYAYIQPFLNYLHITHVDGIMADLGISSHQIDEKGRGFAHRFNGPLDMRMSKGTALTAADILNQYPMEKLRDLFKHLGEIKHAGALAKDILDFRASQPIQTTDDLLQAVKRFDKPPHSGQFRSKLFQALRIEVNGEIEGLRQLLISGTQVLKKGGRFVILSYHSLEDRPVKHFFKTGTFDGVVKTDVFGRFTAPLKPIHSGVLHPSELEIQENNRARSAKLRIAEKIA